jgi:hypothetical protein
LIFSRWLIAFVTWEIAPGALALTTSGWAVELLSNAHGATCFKYDHTFKFYITKAQPKISWRPKPTQHSRPNEEAQTSPVEDEETGVNNVTPPIYSTPIENPNTSPTHYTSKTIAPQAHHSTFLSLEDDQTECLMANFVVDPAPYTPDSFKVEDLARPTQGRIIIFRNLPRRHDEYAIFAMHPPPSRSIL